VEGALIGDMELFRLLPMIAVRQQSNFMSLHSPRPERLMSHWWPHEHAE